VPPACDDQPGGQSAALAGVFDEAAYAELAPGGRPGDLAYRFVTTVAGGVSSITVGLGAGTGAPEEPGQAQEDRCAGVEEWVLTTGERVDRAVAIGTELEGLDPAAPDTPTVLHGWSQEFLRLTDEQRRGAVPPVARDVNALVVGAFNAYSLTMDLLAIAVVTGDTSAVDAAFVALDEGSANFERAATLLDPIVQECG
jgi:hypothetical protein